VSLEKVNGIIALFYVNSRGVLLYMGHD